MSAEPLRIPAGWGWHPSARLTPPTAADLPDLPLLRLIRSPRGRHDALTGAIDSVPGLREILKPADLVRKYGISGEQAKYVLHRRKRP